MLTRVRLAMIWLQPWKLMQTNVMLSKHCSTSKLHNNAWVSQRYALIAVAGYLKCGSWLEGVAPVRLLQADDITILNQALEITVFFPLKMEEGCGAQESPCLP